jgi:hypothetical protein
MSNLRKELEETVRKYKKMKLIENEFLRQNRMNTNDRIAILTQIINELEVILGYSVSIEPPIIGNSIEERLNAIKG